ncbi:MAG: DEAD/DEAH box helicase [Xanthomonadales bacterium]|nr:DEAD/DEAH box helicase [Xanthomonadales bacterium]
MAFARLGLIDPLLHALVALGYKVPTPVQVQALPVVLGGRDLLAAAQTGTGKTAAFALPLLQRLAGEAAPVAGNSVRALVLVPTRELAEQVCASIRAYGQYLPLRIGPVYGGVGIDPQVMQLRKGIDVVVATPGRLLDLYRQNALNFGQVRMLVLDEADRMLELGFSRELAALFAALPPRRQTLLFSATFADAIRDLAGAILSDPVSIDASPRNTPARRVRQWAIPVDKRRKPDLFRHLLRTRGWRQVLVFVKTRKGVEELVTILLGQGVRADSIHGDKPQPARLRALERFRAGEVQVLVATDVAARGLDIDDLPLVVNFDLPIVAQDYIHRIGRTGRAGAGGEAISLLCADEVARLAEIEALLRQKLRRIEEPGFAPDHRVPLTGPATALPARKPGNPGKPKVAGSGPARGRPGTKGSLGTPAARPGAGKPGRRGPSRRLS